MTATATTMAGKAPSDQATPRQESPPIGSAPAGGTSARLRRWLILVPLLIGGTGALGVFGGFLLQDAARTTSSSTAPALIEIQDLFASVAEANAAATSAHLSVSVSDVEDRSSRNLYLDALRRANEQLTVVSAGIGRLDDEPTGDGNTTGSESALQSGGESAAIRTELQNIAASLTDYGSSVEGARVANLNDLPGADEQLRTALDVVDAEIGPSVAAITEAARFRYDDEAGQASTLVGVAIGLGVITLMIMAWIQYRLAHLVRRFVNVFLVLATLAFLGFVFALTNGLLVRQLALGDASDGGYDAIAASAEMQDATFGLQSQLGFLLLEPGSRSDRNAAIATLIAEGDNNLTEIVDAADSTREEAAAEALAVRWARYRDVAVDVVALADASGSTDAVSLLQGEGLSAFNGVNTAIESVLSDNRTQFTDGVTLAQSAVERLPWISLLLAVLAGVMSVVGFQQRLGDYR